MGAEVFLSDSDAAALSGTVLSPSGIPEPTTGVAAWFDDIYRRDDRTNRALIAISNNEVYKDGDTTFAVRAGTFIDARTGQIITTPLIADQALTASQTNYIYRDPDGTLVVNITGFPGTHHIPLATILTDAGTLYEISAIVDYRAEAIFQTINPSDDFSWREDFNGVPGDTLPTPWTTNNQTANSTSDYVANGPGGQYTLTLSADNEAQASQLTWGDNLTIAISNNPITRFRAKIDGLGDMTAVETVYMGLITTHAAAETLMPGIDPGIWFKVKGTDASIYIESDDGTHDINDEDSTIDIVDDTFTEFEIDMSVLTAVKMSIDGVAAPTTLDFSDAAGDVLQVIFLAQRTDASETEVGFSLVIDLDKGNAER